MYLWGCGCFNHKYIAFCRQLITSPLSEEIKQIPPPFSPLPVSVVWEFVFSICPWSECRQQKNGVEQAADAVDRELSPGCARGSSTGGMCWLPAAAGTGEALQMPQRPPEPQQAPWHTRCCSSPCRDCSISMGLGKAKKFSADNSVDWTLSTATSQKIPSVTTATYLFFVVAMESQYFCRNLHSKPSDWICVFKLSRHAWLCCSKNHHLPNPDNLL